MTTPKQALERIKSLVVGDKIPNWRDDFTTTSTRGHIADLCDAALSQLTVSPDREKVAACARKCADDLVQIIETATKVAKRTGNTFVIDRQKVATMISGHLSTIAMDEAAIRADEREKCETIARNIKNRCLVESTNPNRPRVQQMASSAQAFTASEIAAAIRSGVDN